MPARNHGSANKRDGQLSDLEKEGLRSNLGDDQALFMASPAMRPEGGQDARVLDARL